MASANAELRGRTEAFAIMGAVKYDADSAILDDQVASFLSARRKALGTFDVEAYLADYEFRGDEGDYTPNERERILMADFAHGLLNELEAIDKDEPPSPPERP